MSQITQKYYLNTDITNIHGYDAGGEMEKPEGRILGVTDLWNDGMPIGRKYGTKDLRNYGVTEGRNNGHTKCGITDIRIH